MILLIWASERAQDCAQAVEKALQQPVKVVGSLEQGCEALQSGEFSAVLVDQWSAEVEVGQTDFLVHHLGGAIPIFINFGISGLDRILREVRAAFNLRARDVALAQQHVRLVLVDSLKDDITALLLCCGGILGDSELERGVAVRVRTIEEITKRMRDKLLAGESAGAAGA